ncbi:MAG TPA: peptidoglycan recognition family protein [Eudoraea sp.]|nr:peptidoglycan recognition family protein [Eudoraea sp.]
MKCFMFLPLFLVLLSCSVSREIVEKPIVFDEEREQLTLAYLADRYGLSRDVPTIDPKMIVLHWTVIPTIDKAFEAFDSATLPDWRPEIRDISGLNVSSHFMVDRDGTIFRLMPETNMARHVIGLNHCAIGVENVGGTEALPLTREQLKANIWLIQYLKEKYDIEYLIGHYEYTNFVGHEFWLERDDGYRTKKMDPGEDFMKRVRRATKFLNFKPVPKIDVPNED